MSDLDVKAWLDSLEWDGVERLNAWLGPDAMLPELFPEAQRPSRLLIGAQWGSECPPFLLLPRSSRYWPLASQCQVDHLAPKSKLLLRCRKLFLFAEVRFYWWRLVFRLIVLKILRSWGTL